MNLQPARTIRGIFFSVAIALAVSACGGGGGGGGGSIDESPSLRESSLPTVVEDTEPGGTQVTIPASYYAIAAGDQFSFSVRTLTGREIGSFSRTVSDGEGADRLIVKDSSSTGSDTVQYIKSSLGLVIDFRSDPDISGVARQILGTLTEYPSTANGEGLVRTSVRQGSWGRDLDGDGVAEGFRLTFSQAFLGFEDEVFLGKTVSLAHFTTTASFSIVYSIPKNGTDTSTTVEESYFAAGFGQVRQKTTVLDQSGNLDGQPFQFELVDSSNSGRSWNEFIRTNGEKKVIDLIHDKLVYDRTRDVFYATVPGLVQLALGTQVPAGAQSIATIKASTGEVSYSTPFGSSPSSIALNQDGSALYVGLLGSPEIVRVSLPDMTITHRLTIPNHDSFFPQYAIDIKASPTEPQTFAAALSTGQGRSSAVILVRDMALLTERVTISTEPGQVHDQLTASPRTNVIAFNESGTLLYGADNADYPPILSLMNVTHLGLTRIGGDAYQGSAAIPGTSSLDFASNTLILGQAFIPASTLAGFFSPEGTQCGKLHEAAAVCFQYVTNSKNVIIAKELVAFSLPSNTILGRFSVGAANEHSNRVSITAGSDGQVALSEHFGVYNSSSPHIRLTLFKNPRLR